MSEQRQEQMPTSLQGYAQSNDGYTDAGVVAIRLDTAPMLDSIEAFLRGTKIGGYTERGEPVFIRIGTPLANDEGIQGIMSSLTPLFSSHTVQGNFSEEQYLDFLATLQIDLAGVIMDNRINWNIKIENYNLIINTIMNTAEPFFSRTKDNLERESYSQTIKTHETVDNHRSRGFSLGNMFGFNR